jgi:hypothetical protein
VVSAIVCSGTGNGDGHGFVQSVRYREANRFGLSRNAAPPGTRNAELFACCAVFWIQTIVVRTMPKLKMCTCRIECEEIKLADGSSVIVCVTCETYAERLDGRLAVMEERHLTRRRPRARQAASR